MMNTRPDEIWVGLEAISQSNFLWGFEIPGCEPEILHRYGWLATQILSGLGLQGYLAHRNRTPPYEHHRAPGVVPLYGSRGDSFL